MASEGVAYGHIASINVALNRPTEQSSTGHGGSSSRAVDGNTATGWSDNSIAHTSIEDNPWWRVDLQAQRTVAAVRVINRGDCCGTRLDLFTVKVGDQVCGSNLVVPEGETGDFICEGGPLVASSVTIELPGKQRVLSVRPLCSCSCCVRACGWPSLRSPACSWLRSRSTRLAPSLRPLRMLQQASQRRSHATMVLPTRRRPVPAAQVLPLSPRPLCSHTTEGHRPVRVAVAGPGPTQCTACSGSDALVPWRKNGAVAEGACQRYKNQVQVREIPGALMLAALHDCEFNRVSK